jgi:DUF1016 N-terminal domain
MFDDWSRNHAPERRAAGGLPAVPGRGQGPDRAARTRAALAVNSELIRLYWEIGHEILGRQDREGWGAGVTKRLSIDLRREFADMKRLSETNLRHMRAFAQAWPDWEICSPAVSKLP